MIKPKVFAVIILALFAALIAVIVSFNFADAESPRNYVEPSKPVPAKYREWKNFDDGITFYFQDNSGSLVSSKDWGIVYNGENYSCDKGIFMHGGMLDPECVEIILRFELDRRGI